MSTPESWRNSSYTEDAPPPMSRERAQSEIDFLFGTGKITVEFWRAAFDRISGFLGKDFRFAIRPPQGSSAK